MIKLFSFPFSRLYCFKRIHCAQTTTKELGGVTQSVLPAEELRIWYYSALDICLFSPSFYILTNLYQYGFRYFIVLVINSIIHLCYSNCSGFDHWKYFTLTSFDIPSCVCVCVFTLWY